MRQIRNWIAKLSIRQKLVFYSYAIITPILLLISILLLIHNYRAAVKNEENRCVQNVQNISDSIGVVQKNIMEMGTYISINDEIKQILTADEPGELNRDARLWQNRAPMQIIQDMVAIDGQIKSVALYPENGINPYLNCIDRSSSYLGDIGQVRKQEIYALAVQEKGKFLWQRARRSQNGQNDTYQVNQNDKLVMYREIYDMARKNKLGYLVIGSSADIFDEICKNSLSDRQESVVVMSEYGAELVRCGKIEDELLSDIIEKKGFEPMSGEKVQKNICGVYNIYRCQDEETGTAVYEIVRRVGFKDMSDTVIFAPLALLIGFLFGLYPVLLVVSNIVSKPLHTLRVAMENFMRGDFSQKVEVMTQDEVGEASACFNRMVDDIRELIDKNYVLAIKERESELDTLQAQINPHFLYNTLETIRMKALTAGDKEAATAIKLLGKSMRYVLENMGTSVTTLGEELNHVDEYMKIQHLRFGDRIGYQKNVEEGLELTSYRILPLLLQPVVENAIVHGLDETEKDGRIVISVYRKKLDETALLFIDVDDNGCGMTEETLGKLRTDIEIRDMSRSKSIGLYNINQRLKLHYGEGYRVHVYSEPGKGTRVRLMIPAEKMAE